MNYMMAVSEALVCIGLALAYLYGEKKYRLSRKEKAGAAAVFGAAVFAALRMECKGIGAEKLAECLWVLTLLTAAAFTDLRERTVPNRLILLGLAGRLLLYGAEALAGGTGTAGALRDLSEAAAAAGLLLAARGLGRGGLGFGDIKLLTVAGLHCGLTWTLTCLCFGLLSAACVSLWLLAVKRAGKKQRIPLVPCLLAGGLLAAAL